jgi:branched-chain amino acid transport system ATP-binding protein
LLGIAIALSAKPQLLLLDEPLSGMNAAEVRESLVFIRQIRSTGITVLLVEHNMRAVMELCDRIVVLNFGQKIAEDLPDEIRKNKDVIEAYLGAGEYVA